MTKAFDYSNLQTTSGTVITYLLSSFFISLFTIQSHDTNSHTETFHLLNFGLQVKVHTVSESCEGETSTQWGQTVLEGGGVVGGRMHEKRGQQVKLGNMVKIKKETNITQKERRCEIKNIREESKAG